MHTKSFFNKQDTLPNLTLEELQEKIPSQIGPYKIDSLLNKGGMSILYLGMHPQTSKPLVIKILSPKFIKHQEMLDRFLKEADIIRLTNHPNIIQLFGQGRWEQGLYIAMEFVQGISLRQFIQKKSFSTKKAIEIIIQVAYALCHLHTHQVIHRDLKPENILITESGEIKVIDFGIAQLRKEIPSSTATKKIIGTPIYMSPEQKENPETVTFSTDIFSLGMITYELVLGRISHGAIQLSLLPQKLQPIIKKALEKDPKNRYQNIVDFITDLSEYIKETPQKEQEDYRDDLLKTFDLFQETLLPQKPPIWPPIEIGIAKAHNHLLSGIYLDFFQLPENKMILILAEPVHKEMESFHQSFTFRGMIRANIHHFFSSENNDVHLTTFLNSLNHITVDDPMQQHFALSLLMLLPEKNQFIFASCGNEMLFHIKSPNNKLFSLLTPNPMVGVEMHSTFVETASNWNIGDRLIISSLFPKGNTSLLQKTISSTLIFPAKVQAKKILEQLKIEEKPALLLNIERAF